MEASVFRHPLQLDSFIQPRWITASSPGAWKKDAQKIVKLTTVITYSQLWYIHCKLFFSDLLKICPIIKYIIICCLL